MTGLAVRFILLFIPLLFACSTNTPTSNNTAFPYQMNMQPEQAEAIKKVLITSVNIGKPSRKFLQKHEQKIDRMVAAHLRADGLEVASSVEFANRWKLAIRKYGDIYDPTTNKVNQQTMLLAHAFVFKDLKETTDIDAVVYTDLISRKVFFAGQQHKASWDGVTRKVSLQGAGDGVPGSFNWNQEADAVSLMATVYRMEDFALAFRSVGGIEVTDALSLRGTPGFKRRRNVLDSNNTIKEGIALAFHPWILMPNYPGQN
jgi:hypothetical protein